MRLKRAPEDFRVDEVARWDEDPGGEFGIYKLRKRKLTTFEAVRIVAARTGMPLDQISYIGLKDRQAVTTQYVSIPGPSVGGTAAGVRLDPVGRARAPLSSENLVGNDFTVVVRDLDEAEARGLAERIGDVARHGLVNYFDDQRFGSVKAGQGFPAKDLVLGKPEEALRKLIAQPTPLDPIPEKKFKVLVQKLWGRWPEIARKFANRRGAHMVRWLAKKPGDFLGAFQRMPAKERAIHVFAYQSKIWNDAVQRFLRATLPRERLLVASTIAGPIVFPAFKKDEAPPALPETFPLVSHASTFGDARVEQAVLEALRFEGLTLATFRIGGIPGCFFKHEERPLLLKPERMVVSDGPKADDKFPGKLALTISFRLPPGGYATLVLKRLVEAVPLADRPERSPAPRAQAPRPHAPRPHAPRPHAPRPHGPRGPQSGPPRRDARPQRHDARRGPRGRDRGPRR